MRAIRDRHASLSRREQELKTPVVSDLLNKGVAFGLGIRESTIKAHRGQVIREEAARLPTSSTWRLVSAADVRRDTPLRHRGRSLADRLHRRERPRPHPKVSAFAPLNDASRKTTNHAPL